MGDELTSLNVFGFRPCHLPLARAHLDAWTAALQGSIAKCAPGAVDAKVFRVFCVYFFLLRDSFDLAFLYFVLAYCMHNY